MEEPLLTLHLQASYRDYKNVNACLFHKVSKKYIVLKSWLCLGLFACCLGLVWLYHFYPRNGIQFSFDFCVLSTCIFAFIAALLILRITQKMPVCDFRFLCVYKAAWSCFFANKSNHVIKQMVIPFTISFYDTYLTKSTPSLTAVSRNHGKNLLELPLDYTGRLDYNQISDWKILGDYLTIVVPASIFIPIYQISKDQLQQVKEILTKAQEIPKQYILQ